MHLVCFKKAFAFWLQELSLEIASACQEQFDYKQQRLEERLASEGGKAKKAEVEALNALIDKSVHYYGHFLRCYNDPRLTAIPIDGLNQVLPPLDGASVLDDGSAQAYLTSHFCIARLLSRRADADQATRVRDVKASLHRFEWLLANAEKVVPADALPEYFSQELGMCREMVALLPEKLNLLVRGSYR
jgi:hypothetical protein